MARMKKLICLKIEKNLNLSKMHKILKIPTLKILQKKRRSNYDTIYNTLMVFKTILKSISRILKNPEQEGSRVKTYLEVIIYAKRPGGA